MSNTTTIQWAWGQNQSINFNPATDKLDFGWFQSGQFSVRETNGSVVITIPINQQSYTLSGVTLARLTANNIVAKDSGALQAWSDVLAAANTMHSTGNSNGGESPATPIPTLVLDPLPIPTSNPTTPTSTPAVGTVTAVNWAWGSHKDISFNPATDKLDFGWDFQSGQFTLSESNGSTVISIPSNEQTYTLKGVALSALHASNFSSNDASTMTYVMGVVSGNSAATTNPVTPVAPVDASSGSTSGGEVNNGGGQVVVGRQRIRAAPPMHRPGCLTRFIRQESELVLVTRYIKPNGGRRMKHR